MSEKQKRRTFTAESKQKAVDLIANQGYPFNAVSESLGVDATTLRTGHQKLATPQMPFAEDATIAELKAENALLRRELHRVKMEREIIKKATGCFAKQSI